MAKPKDPLAGEKDTEQEVHERDVAAVKEGAKAEERKAKTEVMRPSSSDSDEDPVIDLDADDDDDEEEAPRPSRSERRRERGDRLLQESLRRAEEAERRAAASEQRTHEALMRFAPAKPEEKDPNDAEYEAACQEQNLLLQAYQAAQRKQGGMTQAELTDFEAKARANERRRFAAIAAKSVPKGPTAEEIVQQTRQREIIQEHGDVVSDARALNWARGQLMKLHAEGTPDNKATFDRVMDEARVKFGMTPRNRPAPSEAQKRRMGGIPRGMGGGAPSPRVFTMTKEHRRMADAAFGHIKDDKKRYDMYAKSVGKQLLDEE